MKNQEPTNSEILEAICTFSNSVDSRFDGVDSRFDGVDSRFDKVERRLDRLESQMVTKEYLDDKMADLRGDLVTMIRKGDDRDTLLIKDLKNKKVITEDEKNKLLAMGPFSQSAK